MKYACKRIKGGKIRWYYRRGNDLWNLPGDPHVDRTHFDLLHSQYEAGRPPERRRARRWAVHLPEAKFTREVERAIERAKIRAREWQREFDLDAKWVRDQIALQGCKCLLTGIPFSARRFPGERNPFAPSIDRIDSGRGYTKDNVQIVLLSVNLALADWGEEHFATICRAYIKNRRSPRPRGRPRKAALIIVDEELLEQKEPPK